MIRLRHFSPLCRFTLSVALVLLAIVAPVSAQEFETRTFSQGGKTLPYRLLKPENYDAAKKYPLVLFLHGAGERGADNEAQLKHGVKVFAKPESRTKYPCFVVAPQCPASQKWVAVDWGTDKVVQPTDQTEPMALATALVDELLKEFSVDTDRLYITGISMGGFGTWDTITRFPKKWAAAVPVCGGGDPTKTAAVAHMPLWFFHGDKDPVVKTDLSRQMLKALEADGGHPLYWEYAGVQHDAWTAAYAEPELLPWLFAQRRGQSSVGFFQVASKQAQPPQNLFPGEGPVQSGIWFREHWKKFRTQWAADVQKDQGAVVFFGDSITELWESLAKDFPELKVANRGISGDTTRGLRYRMAEDVLALHPKAVSMMIGTNDLSFGVAPELVLENIKVIVKDLHAADPKMPIVLSKVMPRGARPGLFPDKIQKLNSLLEDTFKNDPKVTMCDSWSIFDDGNGVCKKEEFPDMLHPNAAGYAKWRAALQPIFEQLKLGAAGK